MFTYKYNYPQKEIGCLHIPSVVYFKFTTADLTISDVNITSNIAQMQGGGIMIGSASVVINGGTITGNNSIGTDECTTNNNVCGYGGGIYLNMIDSTRKPAQLVINGGTISGNNATHGNHGADNIASTRDAYYKEYEDILIKDDISNFSYNENTNYNITSSINNTLDAYITGTSNEDTVKGYNNAGQDAYWLPKILKVENGKVYYAFQSLYTEDKYLWVYGNSSTSGADAIIVQMHSNLGGV